jgi:hypothetical protein
MKLPDKRYSADPEFCGYETPRYVARFCGEWLRDSELWSDRAGNQAPAFKTRAEAVTACREYERMRQNLIEQGAKQQARATFYQD